ncbi:Hypothetical_protein [Hexamita inflata]|uniref:Hypothetical_protein n=1 Tax=Hexamita inflata TaxID=28002 RepID=A0AA86UFI6_9EUKA|nr:Hypothetical protein HINF_LOCUS43785 [Hexamita inflata]
MNPLPWREASTILSIIIKYTKVERIPPKKKSKVIQVFVFVLDLMKGTREELNIWTKAQIKKYVKSNIMVENKAYHCKLRTQPRRELQNGTQLIDLDNSLCGIWSYC